MVNLSGGHWVFGQCDDRVIELEAKGLTAIAARSGRYRIGKRMRDLCV